MVKHLIPKSLDEALEAMSLEPYKIMAGGTDLMIQHRSTALTLPKFKTNIIYLFNLDELNYIKESQQGIHIGAMTPLEVLLKHPLTPPLLKEVIQEMASPALRQVATLAGNIGNASPAGDSLVPLYVLDALVVVVSHNHSKITPLSELITGPRKTILKLDELIKEIIIPHHSFTHTMWHKVGGRRADAISKVSFIGAILIDNNIVKDFRVAFGAVYKVVARNQAIENQAIGLSVKELKEMSNLLIEKYDDVIQPIDDQRSNKQYRKIVANNLLKDFINRL